jgi:hypothetical protein
VLIFYDLAHESSRFIIEIILKIDIIMNRSDIVYC